MRHMHALTTAQTLSVTPLTADPERTYSNEASLEHRRRFGQFFTPPKLAELMADWVMSIHPLRVLDPAFGTGMLTAACVARDGATRFTAYETDPVVMQHARRFDRLALNHADFLAAEVQGSYDGIVMNPPYIRHREIKGYIAERQLISHRARCVIPRSANLYVYFTVKALSMLAPGGRASVLIPAEWMSANFARTFKEYLLRDRLLKEVILFSNCSNVFDDALTTASVLLCEK